VRVGTIDEIYIPSNNDGTDPGWLNLAHKRFGTKYHPPTMSCHILQAYFRTLFGDRYEIATEQVPEFEESFDLAGTFWDLLRNHLRFSYRKWRSQVELIKYSLENGSNIALGSSSALNIPVWC
jgi:hypothetical protein